MPEQDFKDGYKAGWEAKHEYTREFKQLNASATGFGIVMMIIGTVIGGSVAVLMLMTYDQHTAASFNFFYAAKVIAVSFLVIISGYFINKKETSRFKQRQEDFNKKWKSV